MLHIVNKSHAQTSSLASCLRLAKPGQVLLLTEDAVYALQPDIDARGMAGKLVDGVTGVDYGGFVDLVAEHPNNQSWL
jgi:tRNA 2-thiouridine synthesizing protein B